MTPSSNKPSHYQRFIPSEEVQEVAAWSFQSMDPGAAARAHTKAQAAADAAQAEAPLNQEALEEARQIAYAEGFEHGRLAGSKETRDALEAPLKQQAQTQAQKLAQLLHTAQGELNSLEHHLADHILALACDLARQVVRRELQQPLEPLKALVQEAVDLAVEDNRPATLKLHPDDLKLVQADLAPLLAEHHVKLVADAKLTPGGCLIESAHGAVDATLEKRWTRAVANLGLSLPWHVDTPTEAEHD